MPFQSVKVFVLKNAAPYRSKAIPLVAVNGVRSAVLVDWLSIVQFAP